MNWLYDVIQFLSNSWLYIINPFFVLEVFFGSILLNSTIVILYHLETATLWWNSLWLIKILAANFVLIVFCKFSIIYKTYSWFKNIPHFRDIYIIFLLIHITWIQSAQTFLLCWTQNQASCYVYLYICLTSDKKDCLVCLQVQLCQSSVVTLLASF